MDEVLIEMVNKPQKICDNCGINLYLGDKYFVLDIDVTLCSYCYNETKVYELEEK